MELFIDMNDTRPIQSIIENLMENELKSIKMTLENNENFVQRYDSIPESACNRVRTALRIILKERFPLHFSFLYALNEYYNKYNEGHLKENSKEWKANERIRKRFLKLYKNFTESDAELLIDNMISMNKIRKLLKEEFITKIDNAKEKREKLVRKIYQLENIKSNEIEEEKKIYSDDEEEKIKSSSQLDPSNVSNNPIDDISDKVILIKKFLEIKKNWKGKKKNSKT